MSYITALLEALIERATAKSALEKVGTTFLKGAEQPGTFQRGRPYAKTPEGLAAQFDWGAPRNPLSVADGILKFPNPEDPTEATWMFPLNEKYIRDNATGPNGMFAGYGPHVGRIPQDGPVYSIDSGPLSLGSGAGTKAYPTMYGHIHNTKSYNIKDTLSGPNAYRNNYAVANAIMRSPDDMGKRLLVSPEQFQHLDVDASNFHKLLPESQVGTLQTEGALETLRRMRSGSLGQPDSVRAALEGVPERLSSLVTPSDLDYVTNALRGSGSESLKPVGPKAVRRLGIVKDALQGREVDPSAFKGIEFREGGLARAARSAG